MGRSRDRRHIKNDACSAVRPCAQTRILGYGTHVELARLQVVASGRTVIAFWSSPMFFSNASNAAAPADGDSRTTLPAVSTTAPAALRNERRVAGGSFIYRTVGYLMPRSTAGRGRQPVGKLEHPDGCAAVRRVSDFRHQGWKRGRLRPTVADDDGNVLSAAHRVADRSRVGHVPSRRVPRTHLR